MNLLPLTFCQQKISYQYSSHGISSVIQAAFCNFKTLPSNHPWASTLPVPVSEWLDSFCSRFAFFFAFLLLSYSILITIYCFIVLKHFLFVEPLFVYVQLWRKRTTDSSLLMKKYQEGLCTEGNICTIRRLLASQLRLIWQNPISGKIYY